MEQFDALEVIARTRGKVEMDSVPTGARLFPLWGWLTAIFYLAAFILILLIIRLFQSPEQQVPVVTDDHAIESVDL